MVIFGAFQFHYWGVEFFAENLILNNFYCVIILRDFEENMQTDSFCVILRMYSFSELGKTETKIKEEFLKILV